MYAPLTHNRYIFISVIRYSAHFYDNQS